MKWCFLIGSPDIGGGTHVVLQHAQYAYQNGVDVTIVMDTQLQPHKLDWFAQAKELRWSTYEKEAGVQYDIVIATWWKTVYRMPEIAARHYLYFVQSIESRFYSEEEKLAAQLADATYSFPLHFVTEAKWIVEQLREKYGQEALLAPNGIDKRAFTPNGTAVEKRNEHALRVLVEGPVDVPFKNVPQTVKLCQQAGADEIWMLTSSPVGKYTGVNRVFSQVPLLETPNIYRSCDVVVKLSYVEGMFGPPLEMFHCGGTAITYDVTGHDEYIVNGYNAIVVPKDDHDGVVKSIQKLKADRVYLAGLQQNALQTAANWVSWPESSDIFYQAVNTVLAQEPVVQQSNLATQMQAARKLCLDAENNEPKSMKRRVRAIKKWVREKTPNLFGFLKRLKLRMKY